MVKTASERAAKYAAKFDPTVVSARYTATQEGAVAAATAKQNEMAVIAGDVRGILNAAGVKPINSVRFIGYANKLYGMTSKFSGATATAEAVEISNSWITKIDATAGDKVVMAQIWNLFSSAIGTAPSPFPSE